MKYVVVLYDGMADYPVPALDGKTPMMVANKPLLDYLAQRAEVGLVKTVADGLKPGSDVANLSVMGYNPKIYYTGRSPLEAASIGVDLKPDDLAFRCNLVTLSDEADYADKTMVDYCAGDISTEEAAEIIESVREKFSTEKFDFYAGVSYRHCLVWHKGNPARDCFTPPHDISGRVVRDYLPTDADVAELFEIMKESYDFLMEHPVNKRRIAEGKNPANSLWFWGQGRKPLLTAFEELYGKKGAVVSAVDLIKGIGKCADMKVYEVDGATGYIDTNFEGKAQAALQALKDGADMVYVHVEAPDECGHRNEPENKVKSIELIDKRLLALILEGMQEYDDYKVMILPDHPTPIVTKTHASDAVPYLIYRRNNEIHSGVENFNEETAKNTERYIEDGFEIMKYFLEEN
ncbi:MAG: cofactor-independent phosphoglycerate mutase [Clostridia bacterium]|nr:cofactor-independent phosphoglycerate mutase [Clostridia bacterium]